MVKSDEFNTFNSLEAGSFMSHLVLMTSPFFDLASLLQCNDATCTLLSFGHVKTSSQYKH